MTLVVRGGGALKDLGGKALALARLEAAGLPVPRWFAVSPTAFTMSVAANTNSDSFADDVVKMRAVLAQLAMAPDVEAEISCAVRELGGDQGRYAVRSSSVEEDSAENSFAGQLESFLFVDAASVASKVVLVWRSAFTDRIVEYRRQRGLSPVPASAPAVLIQQMVNSQAAGVAFSADPVSGRRSIAVVSAVQGMGTALVGGEAETDVYECNRSGTIVRQVIGHKNVRHAFDPNSREGVANIGLSPQESVQPALTDSQVQRVAALARQAAHYFGVPQDIEWAIEDQKLFLLQSRPITTLGNIADPDGVLNIWDNSNITESYNGVTTPLTFSFARFVYEGVYREFCRILRVPQARIAANDRTFHRMLGLVRGRIFYNLLNWYRVLALLPGFTLNRRFMEQMMGVREALPDEITRELQPAGTADRLRDAVYLGRTTLALVGNHFTIDRQIARFFARLEHALAELNPPLAEMRLDELTAHYYALKDELLTHWDAPLVNDFFAMIFHGVLRKLTKRWLKDEDGMLANDAIRGQGGLISAEPAKRVLEMAGIAAQDTRLARTLRDAPLREATLAIAGSPVLKERFDDYLRKFGDRCLEELKLESETLHDDPLTLIRNIGELACSDQQRRQARELHAGKSVDKLIAARLRFSPLKRLLLGWALRNTRERVRSRENLRFERTRLFGRIRRIFLEAGRRLHAIGQLEDPRDVFYLQVEEVLAFVDGTAVSAQLKSIVDARKREFQAYRESEAPAERFETRGPVYHAQTFRSVTKVGGTTPQNGDERSGIGCCPGNVQAAVRVVRDPRNAQIPVGSILVAEHTDPGWIMLFPSAAGLLVERGSLLSHSAIVARELGIPAVVSLPGLTDWLKDGDVVELDGAKGLVRRVSSRSGNA